MCIFAADFRRSGLARRNSHASLACRHSSSILEATSFSDGYKEYLREKNKKIDVLDILDTLETLKILIIKPKPRVRQADRIDQRHVVVEATAAFALPTN